MAGRPTLTSTDRRVASALGLTPAGLTYLGKLAATGKAKQRGNEATKLSRDGLVHPCGPYAGDYAITPAGQDVVRQARRMGW